jgi:quercetin dioxygenase-like cupin family protein
MPCPPRVSALILLAWLAGCGHDTDFGRPAILARNDGEARMLQGRKPMWIKVDPQTLGSRTLTVGMEDMPPGDSIGVHKHLQEDEVVFVHRGEVEITLGDSLLRAAAGATVFIPRGTWIGFRVEGTDRQPSSSRSTYRALKSACGFCRPLSARPSSRHPHKSSQLPDESATKCGGLTRLTSLITNIEDTPCPRSIQPGGSSVSSWPSYPLAWLPAGLCAVGSTIRRPASWSGSGTRWPSGRARSRCPIFPWLTGPEQ